jgi:hypothetical protein
VLELVDDGPARTGRLPVFDIGGQHDRRPDETARHRHRHAVVNEDDTPSQAGPRRDVSYDLIALQPRQATSQRTSQPPERQDHRSGEAKHNAPTAHAVLRIVASEKLFDGRASATERGARSTFDSIGKQAL